MFSVLWELWLVGGPACICGGIPHLLGCWIYRRIYGVRSGSCLLEVWELGSFVSYYYGSRELVLWSLFVLWSYGFFL